MSRCFDLRHACAAAATTLLLAAGAPAQAAPPASAAKPPFGFGMPATAQAIAGWDIDVRPDGAGLPRGKGSVAQGQAIYDAKCASCHGTFGESTDYLPLAGGVGTLGSDQPMRTTGSKLNYATTLFDYIRRAMPFTNPQSLTADEVYALTAYVLHLNDILAADATVDQESLPKVRLPNRDGFTTDHGFMRRDGKPDTKNVACMSNCVTEVKVSSAMPDYARDSHGNLADQTRPAGAVEGMVTAPSVTAKPLAAREIAQQAGCLVCHGTSNRIVGPGFTEVAARYAGNPGAAAELLAKIRAGGVGAWGAVPMPAQPQLKDADATALVGWILAGAH